MTPCSACGSPNRALAVYCDSCGKRLDDRYGARENVLIGSPSGGTVYQAGGDITVSTPASEPEPMHYGMKWRWDSPFTQAALAWIGTGLSVVSLLGGASAVYSALSRAGVRMFPAGPFATHGSSPVPSLVALAIAALAFVAAMASWRLWGVARLETQHLGSPMLPALVGWGHRIGIARFSGRCQRCNGRLRFYNKPMRWNEMPDGRRVITERHLAAECRRNPEHYWMIDPAEYRSRD